MTTKGNWVVGSHALPGNPYDGHTVAGALEKVEKLTGRNIKQVFADRGYRGHNNEGEAEIHIDKAQRGRTPAKIWKLLKQRARIEPVIGHLKQDNRMGTNRLGGQLGNQVNSVLSGAGFNFRKLLRALLALFQLLFPSVNKRRCTLIPCFNFLISCFFSIDTLEATTARNSKTPSFKHGFMSKE